MEKIKILLVDDDESIRGMYAEIFKRENFEVSEAADGVAGLDMAVKNVPDVIFTGIVMPTMDGFALMEALKKNVITAKIPVVISSHLGREEDQRRADELGAKGFFVRGFYTPNEIVEKIRAIFNLAEYRLKFSPSEADAPQLAKDMHFQENFKCASCGGELVLSLKLTDVEGHNFNARFICSKCNKVQE